LRFIQFGIDAAVAAGGVISYDAMRPAWCTVTDPEGNELDFAVSVGREEAWAIASTAD
jgi:hypothetical protein